MGGEFYIANIIAQPGSVVLVISSYALLMHPLARGKVKSLGKMIKDVLY